MGVTIYSQVASVQNVARRTTLVVPNARTRNGIEKELMEQAEIVVNTSFLTLLELADELTIQERIVKGIHLLEPLEEAQYMLRVIHQPAHKGLFEAHQIDLDLARLLLQEFAKVSLQPSFSGVLYEQYEAPLTAIFEEYRALLKADNKWDKMMMLEHLATQSAEFAAGDVYYFAVQPYLPIEQKVLEVLNAQPLYLTSDKQGQLHFHTTYGNKVGLDHFMEHVLCSQALDEAAIFYTDEQLVPQIATALSRYGIATTYSRGLPFTTAPLYEVVAALFDYVEYNYQTLYIKNSLLNGELNFSQKEADASFHRGTVRQLLGVSGVEYGKRIPQLVRKKIDQLTSTTGEQERIAEWQALADYFEQLHAKLAELETGPNRFDILLDVLHTFVRKGSRARNIELKYLTDQLYRFKQSMPPVDSFITFKTFLLKELQSLKWKASGEQPGHLHVAHYEDQLIVQRQTVAVFGLDSGTFPRLMPSSPFVLEGVAGLQTAQQRLQHAMTWLETALSTVSGDVHLYANTFNTNKVREQNVSIFFKKLLGKQDIPKEEPYEVAQLASEQVQPPTRSAETWTIQWDEQDASVYRNVLSPTSISTLLDCSRKYFFQKKMRVDSLDDMKSNVQNWLPANVRGEMIHEVFEKCLQSGAPNKARYLKIATAIYARYKADYEPMQEAHYTFEYERLEDVLDQFIAHLELSESEGWHVLSNEAVIPEQTVISLGEYKPSICITGRIDRIDYKDDNGKRSYRTIDYKTGQSKYNKPIQLLLYNASIEAIARAAAEAVDVTGGESAFYMVFEDDFIKYDAKNKKLQNSLEKLIDKIEHYTLAVNEYKKSNTTCTYCEFRQICSGLEANSNAK